MSEFTQPEDFMDDAMPTLPRDKVCPPDHLRKGRHNRPISGWPEPGAMSDNEVGLAVANILSAPERGVDMVNLPEHYARFKIEPVRFICENKLDFFQGNVVKYIVRHDAKNGIEDIDKVIRYATMYKKFLSGDPDWWKAEERSR